MSTIGSVGGGSATVFPPYTVAPLDGLRSALGDGVQVDHEGGVRVHARQSAAAPELLRLPTGDGPGAEVRFLDDRKIRLPVDMHLLNSMAKIGRFHSEPLDMEKMDPDHPDNRPMIVAERPYFALHYWNGDGLITHFDTVEEHEVLARYNPRRQGLIRMLNKERWPDR